MLRQSGDKLVLRLLDQTSLKYKLEALGFFKNDLEMLYQACLSNQADGSAWLDRHAAAKQ
jgi:type II secretory ATPase GspE/PulE/Tfp pilus assembly ATPase PilB-like protein